MVGVFVVILFLDVVNIATAFIITNDGGAYKNIGEDVHKYDNNLAVAFTSLHMASITIQFKNLSNEDVKYVNIISSICLFNLLVQINDDEHPQNKRKNINSKP